MNIFEMLKYDEGCKLELYKDTENYWTVGIGHLVTKNPNKAEAIKILGSDKITLNQAEQLFNSDVQKTITGIKNNQILYPVYNSLDDIRKMALINMCFQIGITGVAGFKNSLAYLLKKQWKQAATNLAQSKWYRQTPNRAKRVISVFEYGKLDLYK
ncbi:glycoside hydrolase family protein [Serratia marcescens]|uniref:glycoside hydrolase family protein n=1 Tax=Serratia marcescens TaxID=615 RepID=UPI001F150B87|nr:glycoside hydrolase family protein [Serratia marcescens]MDP8728375.1 glycoside hydrolase family protein [Serratia marcescens]